MSLDDNLRGTVQTGEIIRVELIDGTIIIGQYQGRHNPHGEQYGFYIRELSVRRHPLRNHNEPLQTITVTNDSVNRIERFSSEEIYHKKTNP